MYQSSGYAAKRLGSIQGILFTPLPGQALSALPQKIPRNPFHKIMHGVCARALNLIASPRYVRGYAGLGSAV